MEFGEFPLSEIDGAILAHSHRLNSVTLKKGKRLDVTDIEILREAGYRKIVCAKLHPSDVLEDLAADRLIQGLVSRDLRTSKAFTGRCNLFAEKTGLICYETEQINKFNSVDETITLGIVPAYQRVTARQMIATLKIIPFAIPENVLRLALSVAEKAHPLIQLKRFKPSRIGLLQSEFAGTKQSVLDSTRNITQNRLSELGSDLVQEYRCQHDSISMTQGIKTLLKKNIDILLISGASAVVDRRDIIPDSIERVGGTIIHFGMPVDPGNLLLIGRIKNVHVIGMPGCARSPKLNGFDFVLQRLLAGLEINPLEIMRMGPGGLLKDVKNRPLPRAKTNHVKSDQIYQKPKIGAILLAAGQSRRMGKSNKLLVEIDGLSMVKTCAINILKSSIEKLVSVIGYQDDRVREELSNLNIQICYNAEYDLGLSSSLQIGISALKNDIKAILVCLGDMPYVTAAHLDSLIEAYNPSEGRLICVPTWKGKRGNPVLWDRQFFPEIMEITGDVGARHLIGAYSELVVEVEMNDNGVLTDIDTPHALSSLKTKFKEGLLS